MQFPVDQQAMVGLKEAQRILNVGRQSVHDLIESGSLPARKVGNEWQIQGKYLLEWMAKNHLDHPVSDYSLKEIAGPRYQFLSDWT
jgi:excisionase family DNA binding protein